MKNITIKEAFYYALQESKSRSDLWNNFDYYIEKYDVDFSVDNIASWLIEDVVEKKSNISHGFKDYVIAYLESTIVQLKWLSNHDDSNLLLPTIYATHHMLELFYKMIKVITYNCFSFGISNEDAVTHMLPANINDLNFATHSLTKMFIDKDINIWFSLIENGELYSNGIQRYYNKICDLTGMKKVAEDSRFPLEKDSYLYIDRKKMSIEQIRECKQAIRMIVEIVINCCKEWYSQDCVETSRKIMNNFKEDNSNG